VIIKEVLDRYRFIKKKISVIDEHIKSISDSDKYNVAVDIKFKLLSKLQSHRVLIDEQNNINFIDVSTNKISVSDAIAIRNTLKLKIDTFMEISKDFPSIISKMDDVFNEFMVIDNAIQKSDTTVEWDL
jgi:hypothetical protein